MSGNFVPLPHLLIDLLLKGNLSRFEILVTLYLGRVTYDFGQTQTIVPLSSIARECQLGPEEAEQALQAAIQRGTVLPFVTEAGGGDRKFYLLNTEENRRIAGVLEGPSLPPIEPVLDPMGPVPVAPPAASAAPAAPPAAPPTRPAPRTAAPPRPRSPWDRIVALIGRALTRDEEERLRDLKADLELLSRAVDNVEAKRIEVYSSDQILYEYESLLGQIRREEDDRRKREVNQKVKDRVKSCKRCNGMGYLFIGVSTIEECTCRRAG